MKLTKQFKFKAHEMPTILIFEKYCLKTGKVKSKELIKALHIYLNEESQKAYKERILQQVIKEVNDELGTGKIFEELAERGKSKVNSKQTI